MADNHTACVVGGGNGDVNGDRLSDILIGSPGQTNSQGYVYVLFSDGTTNTSARYRRINLDGSPYFGNTKIGFSGVSAEDRGSSLGGSLYITCHKVNTCGNQFATNGLLWEVDAQLGNNSQLQFSFKYNDTQISGWNEADLKLWYRERPCQEWTQDNATLDMATNRITSSYVYDPHREYTIAPAEPSPTQLGLTAFRADPSLGLPWQIAGLILLILLTVAMNWWQQRIWRGRE
jgi:hypothetical protein